MLSYAVILNLLNQVRGDEFVDVNLCKEVLRVLGKLINLVFQRSYLLLWSLSHIIDLKFIALALFLVLLAMKQGLSID
jgi:hypothetical protein